MTHLECYPLIVRTKTVLEKVKILGSFVADALTAEEELPVDTSDKSMLEWAEREAKNLGLLEK
jgi:hypothetical protein